MPKQTAGKSDIRQNLVLRQFSGDVAAIGSLKFQLTVCTDRLVIAIPRARPLRETALTKPPIFDPLAAQVVQNRQVKGIWRFFISGPPIKKDVR